MDNKFSILDDFWMQVLMLDRSTANVLYHLLGGKESHTVVRCQHRCNGWSRDDKYSEMISHEMLAKDAFDLCHAMTIRFIDSLAILAEIKEHPLGNLWEYRVDGKDYYCTPATHVFVYFLDNKLPTNALVGRVGFPFIADDLVINAENPMQIISTATNDGSDLASFVQYLKCPSLHRGEYGALAGRVDVLLGMWGKKIKNE